MLRVFVALCLLSCGLAANERNIEDQVEELLVNSKTAIDKASTFEEKISALATLRANVSKLEETFGTTGNLNNAETNISMSYLESAFESLDELQSYDFRSSNNELGSIEKQLITRKNCSDALARIHTDFDPQSEIPRLPTPVDRLYVIIQSACSMVESSR